MPKLKTNRAAAKRFRVTAKGFKRYSAGRRHNLGDKPRKQKRHLRSGGSTLVHVTDVYRIVQLLPNSGITPSKLKQRYLSKAERAALAANAPAAPVADAAKPAKAKAKAKAPKAAAK
jgi:large subunit ribosomal protein L35